jgi:two-component system sensor histidine kinase HydH
LLEFARPRPPQRLPTNLNDVARSTLELIHFRAADADVRIVADYGELPCLEIDPDAFRQVLLNLFNNAIDAMPHGGSLHISTLSESERVGLVVADVGVGMNADTRDRVFTPFFSTRTGVGNGLGLSVSLQIVEGHGGTIEVESTPGRGSVFTVWLPIAQPAFDGAMLVPGTEATGAGASPDSATGPCAGADPRDGSSEAAA